MKNISQKIKKLYPKKSEEIYQELIKILDDFKKSNPAKSIAQGPIFSEQDVILICYADHIQEDGIKTFQTMEKFLSEFVQGVINKVHFLPFYPWSSDDGFSVKDYYKVNKPYGGWQDLKPMSAVFGFMFDCVANHMSAQSQWFKKFLAGDEKYEDYFIAFSEEEYEKNKEKFAKVFRPRQQPLLTPFKTSAGKKYVWTTFSEDQVDLDFSSPEVFLEMVRILLFYVANGAEAIRLDAIAYAWKKLGTNCFDLPKAHTFVQAMREIFNEVAPHVWIITETVLPHKENVKYFGNGRNEAHLVYHFQLETLLLHTMLTGDTAVATEWLKDVRPRGDETGFLNLSVSHDGIHTIPAMGILNKEQMEAIADDCAAKGGKVLERDAGGGETEIYEMNITYPSAVGKVKKYLASQSIQIALQGVPLIYLNNFIGADNWQEGVKKLGYGRAINRQKFNYQALREELNDPNSRKHKIYHGYVKLLKARINEPLFSPLACQEILSLDKRVMAIQRFNNADKLLALTNVSDKELKLDSGAIRKILDKATVKDIISKKSISLTKELILKPYQVLWLK